jgi:hypothetical protein
MTSWQDHVKNFREKHPDLSFKEALVGASKTYQKNTTKPKHKQTRKHNKIKIKEDKPEKLIY